MKEQDYSHYQTPYDPDKPREFGYVVKDGKPTNADIHDEILDNPEAEAIGRRITYEYMKSIGCPEHLLKGYL